MDKRLTNRGQAEKTTASAGRRLPTERADDRRGGALTLAATIVIGGAIWAVYAPGLHAPFVFDDHDSVLGNPSIVRLWPLLGDTESPGPLSPPKDSVTAGRPLVNLSLAINYHFGWFNPAGYHALNVTLHMLSALLLFGIVRRALQLEYFAGRFDRAADPLALAVALVWAVHPLASEAVEYVTQRSELLVSFCYLSTIYAAMRYWHAQSSRTRLAWLVVASAACLAGMASKEVMVSAPVVVLLFERTLVAGSFREALRRSRSLYVGLACGWLLLFVLNYAGPRSGSAGFDLGVPAHVWWFAQAKVLLMYLKLAIWPWPLVIHYERPYLDSIRSALPWLLPVAALALATFLLVWRRSAAGLLAASVFLILSPTLIVPILTEVAAERRMYLPLAALCALVIVGGYALAERVARLSKRNVATPRSLDAATIIAALIMATALGAITVRRLEMYDDPITLWSDAAARQPDSYIVHNNLGLELAGAGRQSDAIEEYERALRLRPDFAQARLNLAVELLAAGRIEEAAEQGRRALDAHPDFPEAHYNLGVALHKSGRVEEARTCYKRALALRPGYAEAHTNLGAILNAAGQTEDAIAHFATALQQKPDYVEAHANLAVAYARLGHASEAIAAAQRALDLARLQGQTTQAEAIASWLESYRASTWPRQNEGGSRQ
jgi:tetratricopeptide (TPR) repeat protein